MKNDDFRFYIPIEEDLVKGKDKTGKEVYKFKGLASTDREDSDGEFLEPEGFDLDSFNFVNYNHFKEPKYLIGEPTKAKVVPGKGLMVEGNIWADTEVGSQVIDLMKTLKKNSTQNRRLGISVEGKALERSSINPKRVTKAKITAIALCPIPKNGDTWAELIEKGFTSEDKELVYEYEDFIEKSHEANGGSQYIIDVTNPETGMRYTVAKDFSIKVEKAMTTEGSAKGTIKEDVEKDVKNLISSDKNIQKAIVVLAAANKQGKLSEGVLEKVQQKFKI